MSLRLKRGGIERTKKLTVYSYVHTYAEFIEIINILVVFDAMAEKKISTKNHFLNLQNQVFAVVWKVLQRCWGGMEG